MAQVIIHDEAFQISLAEYVDETMPRAINDALEKACSVLLNAAIRKCPVDSGQLQRSLTMEIDEGKHIGQVGTNLEYAPYVEIGTGIYSTKGDGRQTPWTYQDAKGEFHTISGNKAQPFLQPALEEVRSQMIEVMKDAFRNS